MISIAQQVTLTIANYVIFGVLLAVVLASFVFLLVHKSLLQLKVLMGLLAISTVCLVVQPRIALLMTEIYLQPDYSHNKQLKQ